MILIRHYFPGVDAEDLDDEGFAMMAMDAEWLHGQKLQMGIGALSAGLGARASAKR